MWFAEEDILETILLEPKGHWQLMSPTPEGETALLSKPQEDEALATCPPRHKEQAPKPNNAAKLREAVIEPKGIECVHHQQDMKHLNLWDSWSGWIPKCPDASQHHECGCV